jgi:predicted type IV restriction endonuclease
MHGDSVQMKRLTALWILSLEPKRLKNPTATAKDDLWGWNGLSVRDA